MDGGELADLQLLGRERDTPGSIWTEGGQVLLSQPRPRTFEGFDVTAIGPLTSTLRIELRAAEDQQSNLVEIPIAELVNEQRRATLASPAGRTSTTLMVHRIADDAIRVKLERDTLVYAPGETLKFTVEPALPNLAAGSALDLAAELSRGRAGNREWDTTVRVSLPAQGYASVPVEIPLPTREGVYSIKLIARTPPGNRVKFWETATGDKLAERTFQVVVLSDQATEHFDGAQWQTAIEIDPANPKWWGRMTEWTRLDRITNLGTGPLGSEAFRTSTIAGRAFAELSPSNGAKPTWQAYPLPAAQPGQPHVVEVELPTGEAQQLALRIYEYDAQGKLAATTVGGGVVVDKRLLGDNLPANSTYRYLFWPHSKTPVAVLENVSNTGPARYGRIRLRIAKPMAGAPSLAKRDERLVAATFDWQTLVDRTSSRPPTGDGRPAIDDLQTFVDLAQRTAALVELSGYNGAVVGVMDGGSAAFDLRGSDSLPSLNTSALGSSVTDLPTVNPTDLLLRVFASRGLRVVPMLRMNATLPTIEANLRASKYQTLDEYPLWTDLGGRPRRAVMLESTTASPPHYQIGHPDVMASVRGVVQELIAQASGSPAFAGVAIEISPDSYIAAPPSNFGFTRAGLTQLAAYTEATEETIAAWNQNPQAVLDDPVSRRAWDTQRAQGVTRLVEQLAGDVIQAQPEAKLYVTVPELFKTREFEIRPKITGARRLEDAYLERGLDLASVTKLPDVAMIGTQNIATGLQLADAAEALELNSRSESLPAASLEGMFVWHQTAPTPVPQAAEFATSRSPRTPIAFDYLGASVNAPIAAAMLREHGGAFLMGGPAGPAGLGDDDRRLALRMLAKFPAHEFQPGTIVAEQTVVANVHAADQQAVATVTNNSPWQTVATVTLGVNERTAAETLTAEGAAATAAGSYAPGQHAWRVPLAPYETQALRFASPQVQVTGVRVEMNPAVAEQLAARCTELERRDLRPDVLPRYQALANPSFEQIDTKGMAVGWEGGEGVATATPGADGQRAAVLRSTEKSASIATLPFATPGTGEIAVLANVRVINLSDDAELRLIVEASGRRTTLTQSAAVLKQHSTAKEWNAYQFGVEDLPLNSNGDMRIRVELVGTGEVWIDNLQLHHLVYPLRIYPKESDQQVLALVQHVKSARKALETQQYGECQELLDAYWSQFLIQHLPEITVPESTSPEATANEPTPEPRMSDRMKSWFRF
jgi:hypothetical protein